MSDDDYTRTTPVDFTVGFIAGPFKESDFGADYIEGQMRDPFEGATTVLTDEELMLIDLCEGTVLQS